MANVENRLVVNLSEILLPELSDVLVKDSKKKNSFAKNAILMYIEEQDKHDQMIKEMERGYREMASLNLEYSEFGFESYLNEINEYENQLSESEMPNDDNVSEKRRYFLC